MPHLTSTGQRGTADAPTPALGFGVPGYAHPLLAPAEWAELTRPGTPLHWVVLNVADGPGARPDPHCLEAAGRLRNAGVRVLGHLDTAYGPRPFGELVSDAHRFLDWYRVDGFLLDRCPPERADAARGAGAPSPRCAALLRAARHVVLGHGTHPHPGYAEIADQLVTFSGPWSDYRWSQVAEWTADHPPERFCHFVHGVPRRIWTRPCASPAGRAPATIYFTDRTDRAGRRGRDEPWEALPGYWDEIVSRIGPGVSE